MTHKAILLTALLAVAGCDKPAVDERNASVAEVATAVRKAQGSDMKFTPGRWESTFAITAVDAPGMPPEAAKAMGGMVGRKQAFATCLTKEQAAKPGADFFSKDARNCTYERFTMGGGKIDAKMRCGAGETQAVVDMEGGYSATRYQLDMATVTNAGGPGSMTMRMAIDARYAGACKGDEGGRG